MTLEWVTAADAGAGFADVAVPPDGVVIRVPLGVAAKERAIISGFEASQ